ncbi:MAG: heparin lyase I family protein [Saprospiraceae bacterium]
MKFFFPILFLFFSILGHSQALFCEDFETTTFTQIQDWYLTTFNTQAVPNGSYFGALHANSLVDLNQNGTTDDDLIFKQTEVVDFDNSGNKALKFTFRRVPRATYYDAIGLNEGLKTHLNRNELATYDRNGYVYEDDKTYWFQWRTYLDPTYDLDEPAAGNGEILGQVHFSTVTSIPPICVKIINKKWRLNVSRDTIPGNGNGVDIDMGTATKEVWVNWKLKVRLSTTADGLIEFWKDDVLVHSETGQNIVVPDNFYFKIGIYKPGWFWTLPDDFESTKTAYFDDFWADTTAFVNGLSLDNLDCHRRLTIENSTLSTKKIAGNPTYEFSFTNVADNSEFFITADTATIDLFSEDRITRGQAYRVKIRIPNHPLYGNYASKTCVVNIDNNWGLKLLAKDCNKTLTPEDMTLTSIASEGNHIYKFRIVKVSSRELFFIDSPTPTIDLSENGLFEQGEAYHVRIRITGHSSFAAYGANCTFMIAAAADCPNEIIHDNQVLATGDYLSSATIVSEAIIEATSTVTYKAETAITLSPNFHAQAGSIFSASIDVCNPSNQGSKLTPYIPTVQQAAPKTTNLTVFPNPFSGTTLIQYELPQNGLASLELYTLTGKKITSFYQKERKSAGLHQQLLNLNDFPKGIYFVVLQNEAGVFTQKIVYQ